MPIKNKYFLLCACILFALLLFYALFLNKPSFALSSAETVNVVEASSSDDSRAAYSALNSKPVAGALTNKNTTTHELKIDEDALSSDRYLARKFIADQAKNKIKANQQAMRQERNKLGHEFVSLRDSFVAGKITKEEFKVQAEKALDSAVVNANLLSEEEVIQNRKMLNQDQ